MPFEVYNPVVLSIFTHWQSSPLCNWMAFHHTERKPSISRHFHSLRTAQCILVCNTCSYIIGKCILPFYGLCFKLFEGILWPTKVFNLDEMLLILWVRDSNQGPSAQCLPCQYKTEFGKAEQKLYPLTKEWRKWAPAQRAPSSPLGRPLHLQAVAWRD